MNELVFHFFFSFNPKNRPFITNSGLSAAKNGIGMNGYFQYLLMLLPVYCHYLLMLLPVYCHYLLMLLPVYCYLY